MQATRRHKNISLAKSGDASGAPPFTPRLTAWAVYLAMSAAPVASALMAGAANAQPVERTYDIPAGPLSSALSRFAAETGILLSTDARLTDGKSSPGIKGKFGVEAGLGGLLKGTGLAAKNSPTGYVLEVLPPAGNESLLPEVSVTGAADQLFDTPPEQPGLKAEYQDSATKTPLSIRETPQAISVITRDSMNDRQVRDVNSALELASGVTAGRSGQGGPFAGRGLSQGENFNLRGQDLNENRDVRIDGFSASSSSFDTAAFERVEAVKGPSSMLYGQGSLGGFVNLVRKKPQAERSASVAGQVGSFDTRRAEADITGALNSSETVRGRLTAAYDDSGSFTDGVETRIAMIAPSIDLRISERTRVLLEVLYQEDKYVPSQGVPLKVEGTEARAPDIPRSRLIGLPSQEKSTAENLFASARVDHEIADRWLASLFLQSGKQDSRRFFDSYGYDFSGLATGDISMGADTAHIENENWAGELRLDGRFDAFGREHLVLLGLEKNQRKNRTAFGYAYLGTANIYTGDFASVGTVPGGAGSLPFNRDSNTTSDNEAAYGQVVLAVLDRTKLMMGLRYDQSDQERFDNIAGVQTGKQTDYALTKRLGLTQELTRNITAYASYAESFNPVEAETASGEFLDPETGKGYELGLKTEWFEKRLAAGVAVFRQDLDNVPIPDPADPNFSVSGGKQRTYGLEIEVSGSPRPGLNVGFSAAWLNAKYVDPADPNYGLKPYESVDWMSSVFASYEIQGGPMRGFGMGATLVAQGKRSASFAGSGAQYGTGTDELYLPGYERLDLNFYYRRFKNWGLALQVRNVTDEVYIERFRDVSGSNYFGSPRAALFRAEYRFF